MFVELGSHFPKAGPTYFHDSGSASTIDMFVSVAPLLHQTKCVTVLHKVGRMPQLIPCSRPRDHSPVILKFTDIFTPLLPPIGKPSFDRNALSAALQWGHKRVPLLEDLQRVFVAARPELERLAAKYTPKTTGIESSFFSTRCL